MNRYTFRSVIPWVALLVAVLITAPVGAQRVTGIIAGNVTDGSGDAMPGVTVSLTGDKVVGTQTAITNASGFYRFPNLPPGEYTLSYALEGFKTEQRTGVRSNVGRTSTESVILSLGDVSETITVTSEVPIVDTVSNEVGINFDQDWIENAPVQRGSFNDLVAQAPGALRGGDESRRTMVFGSSYDENSFQLDGADVNDNFFNEQLAQPNIDAIEEIEVLSLGAPAEYGNLTGAVYNIVTRQGTNDIHGDLNAFYRSDSLTSRNTDDEQDEGFPFKRDKYNDYTAQLGGPIAQDKLFYFLSYQRQEDGFSGVGVDPEIGTVVQEFDRYFGKLNYQASASHSFQLTYHEDESVTPRALGQTQAPSEATTRTGETPTPGIGYTGVFGSNTVVDVRFTGFYGEVFVGPTDPNQPLQSTRFIDLDSGLTSGGWYYYYDLEPERTTINTKVQYLADDFLGGSHDFRFGVQYNESSAGGIYGYNDLVLLYDIGGGARYGYGYTRVPFSYSGNTEAIGIFVDDTIRINDRLSVNVGVRYDSNDAFSEAQQELNADGTPTGVVFPRADYYTWEYVSPRLGFNWQLDQSGRTVLKGHVGRYHRAIATGEFANVLGPSIKPVLAGGWDPATQSFAGSLAQLTSNENLSIDPGYDSPRTDQFILSLEHQLSSNMGISVNLVKKEGRDFAAWRDVGSTFETVQWIDGDFDLDGIPDGTDPFATGNAIDVISRTGGEREFLITNRDEMDNDIEAASVEFYKRMSNRWSLNANFTYLKSEGRTPDSLGGVSVQQRGGLQFRNFGRNPNDFVNSGGRLRGDIPWQVKAQFVYQLPKGFLAAVNFSARDGANRVRRTRVPTSLVGQSTTILAVERGDFGRLDEQYLFDLRLEKDFKLNDRFRLAVIADVFNVFNQDVGNSVLSSIGTSANFNIDSAFARPRQGMLGAKLRF
ncbi:MAG: TonB-dependent receptor [Acidobacteriota bacterium]